MHFGRVVLSFAFVAGLAGAATDKLGTEYSHRTWRIEDGLPQDRVRALTQTVDGYLWIGTAEGLARFDGVRFTIFDRSNTPAFHDDSILALLVTSDGALWAGTEGGGLVRYAEGGFRNFGEAEGLTNGFVRAIFEDTHSRLWVGTARGFFRRERDGFVRLDNTPEIPLATVRSIGQDPSGNIWVVTQLGMLTLRGQRLARSSLTCNSPDPRTIERSGHGFLWGLSTTGLSRVVDGCATMDTTKPNLPFRSLIEDQEGNLWIGTTGRGLVRFRGGRITSFQADSILPDNTVNAVFEDLERNIWIGSDGGLTRLARKLVKTLGRADGLDEDDVLTTYADRQGQFWLATLSGQVYRTNGSRASRYFLPYPGTNFQIQTVFQDSKNMFWFGTLGSGVVRVKDGTATVYSKSTGMRSNNIRQILEDATGRVWFALGSGVSAWNGAEFRNYYLEDGLSYPSARCLLEDKNGDILVGTDAGLNRIHNGRIVRDEEFASLKNEKIWSIHQSADRTLWLGTRGSGLLRFSPGSIAKFSRSNGLMSDTIFQILEDRHGDFWLSTSSGVISIKRKSLRELPGGEHSLAVTAFGAADGVMTGQMNGGIQPAGARAPSGEMWFPSLRGAVRFDPDNIGPRPALPVLIERIAADSRTIPAVPAVSIHAGYRRIEIDFTMCDLVTPQRVSFRYKLEGVDENWTPALRTRSATYTNLSPGTYKFRVIGSHPGSPSGLSEAAVTLTLAPSFYQTRWFYLLLFVLLGAMAWGGFALYARQTRLRFTILLAERARLAREMHDTVIQGCVGVATLLEAAAEYRSSDPEQSERLVEKAKFHVTSTLAEAREAVWGLRQTSPPEPSVSVLVDFARKLGNEERIQIETEIEHAANSNEESFHPMIEHTILLIGQEALRNAAAHARPSRIEVHVTYGETDVKLEVIDDGIGLPMEINEAPDNRHFGLVGMRERTQQAGGLFRIESQSGSGTKVTAILPRVPRFRGEAP